MFVLEKVTALQPFIIVEEDEEEEENHKEG
jgi:hypothetical protein